MYTAYPAVTMTHKTDSALHVAAAVVGVAFVQTWASATAASRQPTYCVVSVCFTKPLLCCISALKSSHVACFWFQRSLLVVSFACVVVVLPFQPIWLLGLPFSYDRLAMW